MNPGKVWWVANLEYSQMVPGTGWFVCQFGISLNDFWHRCANLEYSQMITGTSWWVCQFGIDKIISGTGSWLCHFGAVHSVTGLR
jgi:hypothetical protein